jgi:hypothetical protein
MHLSFIILLEGHLGKYTGILVHFVHIIILKSLWAVVKILWSTFWLKVMSSTEIASFIDCKKIDDFWLEFSLWRNLTHLISLHGSECVINLCVVPSCVFELSTLMRCVAAEVLRQNFQAGNLCSRPPNSWFWRILPHSRVVLMKPTKAHPCVWGQAYGLGGMRVRKQIKDNYKLTQVDNFTYV